MILHVSSNLSEDQISELIMIVHKIPQKPIRQRQVHAELGPADLKDVAAMSRVKSEKLF